MLGYCKNYNYGGDMARFRCSNCGWIGWVTSREGGTAYEPNYCPSCGFLVLKVDRPDRPTCKMEPRGGTATHWYVCSECEAPLKPCDRYCYYCGAKVVE